MTVLAGSCVHEHTNKVEHVRFFCFAWVTEMVDMVGAYVNGWWELEMIVDLPTAKIGQVELEALQMKNEVVGHLFETGSTFVSFVLCQICVPLTA
jgi:hypothetical protein